MKTIIAAAAAAFTLSLAGQALAADDSAIMTPVNGFIEATGKAADINRAASYWTANQSMVDEFAPYHWTGPNAVRNWWAGFLADSKKSGATDAVVVTTARPHILQTATHAYVVQPARVELKVKGKPVAINGLLTFALDRTKAGWKIASCAWSDQPAP